MTAGIQDATRATDIGGLLEDPKQIEALRHHLDELSKGTAFRGSHRSQQFLRYIVEKTLQGSVEHLKERTIGIELFQRSPSYDTGGDAIVRVTASDVRRRLQQHYGRYGDASRFRIHLHPGSYVPEIAYDQIESVPAQEASPAPVIAIPEILAEPKQVVPQKIRWRRVIPQMAAIVLVSLGALAYRQWRSQNTMASIPPWSTIFRPGHTIQLITSDPNIDQLQELTGNDITISDYANQRYVANPNSLSPQLQQFYQFYLHADNAASVDPPLAVNIARLVPADLQIDVRSARSLRITDIERDDNLILLGGPRSNPWFQFFESQLDFKFVFSKELNQEIIQNVHPLVGEQSTYVPTARGFATGESFAILALVQNPNHPGQVLLVAGADGEGTEAAGQLVTDKQHLLHAMQFCGLPTQKPVQHFELLLRLHTMAGSPSTVDLASCHHLASYKAE